MSRVPASRYVVFLLVCGSGLMWDLWSKHAVFRDLGYPAAAPVALEPGTHDLFETRPLVEGQSRAYLDGWLSFRLFTSFNHGALAGIGQGHSGLFAGLSMVAAMGMLYWLFVHGAAQSKWLTVSLALVMAGALGNLYDRLGWHGCVDHGQNTIFAVRDFLLFTFGSFHWPVFNFADTFLVTGSAMLVLPSLLVTDRAGEEAKQPASARAAVRAGALT